MHYYEVTVEHAGTHGFIAIGWARRGFEGLMKQPGWVAHSYGYHGDDGCAYSGYGYGRRFGPTFTAGHVVGTGLVICEGGENLPPTSHIFYTLDGELQGTPFAASPLEYIYRHDAGLSATGRQQDVQLRTKPLPSPELLLPAVGLHSPGERVTVNFGGSSRDLLQASPPAPPRPFAFDLTSYVAKLSPPEVPRPFAGSAGSASSTAATAASEFASAAASLPTPPPGAQPLLRILPWALHDVVLLALRSEGSTLAADERAELLRYATSRLGRAQANALHPSWGVSSIDQLTQDRLSELVLTLLHRDAARALTLAAGRGRGGRGRGGGGRGRGRGRGGEAGEAGAEGGAGAAAGEGEGVGEGAGAAAVAEPEEAGEDEYE